MLVVCLLTNQTNQTNHAMFAVAQPSTCPTIHPTRPCTQNLTSTESMYVELMRCRGGEVAS
jgi:hypothetical protein